MAKTVNPIKITADTREQLPYEFKRIVLRPIVAVQKLDTGDYAPTGYEDRMAVERKSLADIVGCLTGGGRDRFERELERSMGMDFFAIMIEASVHDVRNHNYTSKMLPHAVFQSLLTFQVRYGVHVIWAGDRDGGEYLTYWLIQKWLREIKIVENIKQ